MKFSVSAITNPFGELVDNPVIYTNPEEAILKWCEFQEDYPTCVSICPETKEDGLELLKWASLNPDKIEAYMLKHDCPYKFDWLMEAVKSAVKNNKCSMQWEYDQLYPFCMG